MITRDEFAEWQNHPVTQELFAQMYQAAESYTAEMVNRPVTNPDRDQWVRGAVNTISHLAQWKPELVDGIGDEL